MSADASGSHPTRAAHRAPGEKQVGKYQLLSELGRGGTANVYLAIARGEVGISKLVVLKALLPELAEDPSAVTMFTEEARLAAQLNHPNVVQTYDVGTEGDRSVIVMEFLDGRSFSQILRHCEAQGTPFPRALHLRVLIDVLEGLHYAHELKSYEGVLLSLVHRDVSPQNVFVTYDGQVKILDFGIAKAAWSTQTEAGVMKGKLNYMAPEQMSGGTVDRRADIYAFGCMLWAAAAGVKLWHDCTDAQVVRRVLSGRVPSPKTVNPECPDELEAITMKALRLEREERYATALELQTELERFVEKAAVVPKRRELGQFVSSLFAEARAELRANIEREVAMLPTVEALALANELETTQDAFHKPGAENALQARSRARHAFVPLLVIAAAALIVAVTWWTRRSNPVLADRPAQKAELGIVSPSSPTSSGDLALHTPVIENTALEPTGLRDAASPPSPKNDARLDRSAPDVESRRAGASIAAGKRAPVVASSTARSELGERTVPSASASAAAAASSAAPVLTAEPPLDAGSNAPSEEPSCENPFYIDRDGIKHVRPDCR